MYKVNYYQLDAADTTRALPNKEDGLAALRSQMQAYPEEECNLVRISIETSTPNEAVMLAAEGRCTSIERVAIYKPFGEGYDHDPAEEYELRYFRRWRGSEPGRVLLDTEEA